MSVAWITGASGGIGRNVLEKLSAQGWTVVASGRDHDSLQQLSSELDNIHILPVDVTDHIAMKDAADKIKSEFGQLDALVHAVGSILLRPASRDQCRAVPKYNFSESNFCFLSDEI